MGIQIVITGIRKARMFADAERAKKIRANVRLFKMNDRTVRAVAVYRKRGTEFIYDPQLGYAYPRAVYADYSRRRIVRETPLGRTIAPGKAALRLFRTAKDAVGGETMKESGDEYTVGRFVE
jgi:hypothetical protein